MSYVGSIESIWTPSAVQRILKNDIYVGTLRLGKTEKNVIKGKSISKPESQQYVFEENHTPIISIQQFEEVQSMLAARKKTGSKGAASRDNIFSGLLYCMDCGARMIAYNKAGKPRSYICSSYHRYGKSSCRRHSIRESDIVSIIKEYLKAAAENQKEAIMRITLEEWNPFQNDNNLLLQELKQELSVMREKYKMLIIQKITDLRKENGSEYKNIIQQSFEELEESFQKRILYLENKICGIEEKLSAEQDNHCRDALQLVQRIIDKPSLSRRDIEILIERIDLDSSGNLLVHLMGSCTSICYHTPEDANLVPGQ
jgi:hypothetical protein